MGFHHIELEEGSRDIRTFSAGDSLFRYKRLSFGINSAPEQYQNIIRQTIAGCPGATNIADDIVVHGKTAEDHDRNLITLLDRLQERNLTLNMDKCKFGMSQIVFMGLLLNKHGVGPTEEKVKAIRESGAPANVAELRRFLRLVKSYKSTPHTTTGVSPAELLYRRKIRTQMPEFEADEEEQRSGTADQQARDQDAEQKKRMAETAKGRAAESGYCCCNGNKTSCLQRMIQIHKVL